MVFLYSAITVLLPPHPTRDDHKITRPRSLRFTGCYVFCFLTGRDLRLLRDQLFVTQSLRISKNKNLILYRKSSESFYGFNTPNIPVFIKKSLIQELNL